MDGPFKSRCLKRVRWRRSISQAIFNMASAPTHLYLYSISNTMLPQCYIWNFQSILNHFPHGITLNTPDSISNTMLPLRMRIRIFEIFKVSKYHGIRLNTPVPVFYFKHDAATMLYLKFSKYFQAIFHMASAWTHLYLYWCHHTTLPYILLFNKDQ